MKTSLDISLFNISFILYLGGFISFAVYTGIRHTFWHRAGAGLMAAGLLPHTAAFFIRWHLAGFVPLSNMYEYLSVMAWMAVLALLVIYFKYQRPLIGSLIAPLVFMLIVTAALLPKNINQSLMPALQSFWLNIHVSLAAIGSGCFLIAFAASMIFLLRSYHSTELDQRMRSGFLRVILLLLIGLPISMTIIAAIFNLNPPSPISRFGPLDSGINLGGVFILLGLGFVVGVIITSILWQGKRKGDQSGFGGWLFASLTLVILIGFLIEGILLRMDWLELTHNFPAATHGKSVKSAWLIFEFIGVAYGFGLVIFFVILPLLGKIPNIGKGKLPIGQDLLDEISYKTVSIGYPLYTVGALFAGAIWAEQAWGSFWSWDPKEVGALIIWLFYSGYLHARYQRGWSGSKAAILVVAGFLMVLVSFLGNYFFGGLHTYA